MFFIDELLINILLQLMRMSKSDVINGDTQAEADAIDNNNEWKVSLNNLY